MLRRLSRISLVLVALLSSQVWALGLGEIRLDSALNEPLRAEIQLLSATPEELTNLKISLASAETFERYGLDRPAYLQGIEFMIINNVVEIRSRSPITEPFVTFLVDATWARGRLLREYTILLDPPTFAPPTQSAPAVTAPQRSAPADSGRIERESAPAPQPRTSSAPAQSRPPVRSDPEPQPVSDDSIDDSPSDNVSYDSTDGSAVVAQRGQTLWGIAQRVRPDSRLTMNQTMLAIFEANPDAFGGNINVLRAGASLRIPSADEIFRIGSGDALSEVKRQHAAWEGGVAVAPVPVVEPEPQPSLQLVPPDDDIVLDSGADDSATDIDSDLGDESLTREEEIEQRISELEAADVPQQRSLIEIRDNELATLREELARIRGEVYEPVLDAVDVDDGVDDELVADSDVIEPDDTLVDDQDVEATDTAPVTNVVTTRVSSPSLVDKVIAALTSMWAVIGGALILVLGLLVWFMRRGRDDDDESGAWNALDGDEITEGGLMSATASLAAPSREEDSFVVVEQDSAIREMNEETIEAPVPVSSTAATGTFDSLEDTFSSETAINLDQSDPVAEADFHMAYGLYDQAADLINGALAVDPDRQNLLTKLCEIYFVWGNRDAFVDAAGRLTAAIGSGESADWDKIVIMGQQIAADHELFAGAGIGAATKAVDLSFEAGMGETGALDMELGFEDGSGSDVIDLGMDEGLEGPGGESDGDVIDFLFDDGDSADIDLNVTRETAAIDAAGNDVTAEMPTAEVPMDESISGDDADSQSDSPTIEQQFDVMSSTAELPSLAGEPEFDDAVEVSGQTAEINLDDLGLDISGFDETELASLDDLDATSENETLSATGVNEVLDDLTEVTGKNPEIDPDSTGLLESLEVDATGMNEALVDMDIGDVTGTNTLLNLDSGSVEESTDVDFDDSLLDATGLTQVLSEDLAVETATGLDAEMTNVLSDADATMLASGYGDDDTVDAAVDDDETMLAGLDDEEDFDFAKTEALPPHVFTGDASLDETGELPAVASTDFDLDLDDLTAALKVSEMGDTVDQPRDDATVEQPRPGVKPADDTAETLALAPADLSEDLHDARTMTEVGTKLDLARAYVDMGDPAGARSILEEVLDEGDNSQQQQAQQLLDSLP